jgi:hypothetical protein
LAAVVSIVLINQAKQPVYSFVVGLPGSWTSPHGEVLSGIITYTPKEDAYSLDYGPAFAGVAIIDILPGGDRALAEVRKDGSSAIGIISRTSQSFVARLARFSGGERGLFPVLSPDEQTVAYLFVPTLPESLRDASGNAYAITSSDDPLLRLDPALKLPAQYQPQLRIAKVDGAVRYTLPGLRPLAFSSDGSRVLAQGAGGLSLVSLRDGTQTPVQGSEGVVDLFNVSEVSRNGSVMALQDVTTGAESIYVLDWSAARLAPAGPLPPGEVSVLMNGMVAVHDIDAHTLTLYQVRDAKLAKKRVFNVMLPAGADILALKP